MSLHLILELVELNSKTGTMIFKKKDDEMIMMI